MSILVGPTDPPYYPQPRSFVRQNAMTHGQWNAYSNAYANNGLGGRAFGRSDAMTRGQWDQYANTYANNGLGGRAFGRSDAMTRGQWADYANAYATNGPPGYRNVPSSGIPRQDARRFGRMVMSPDGIPRQNAQRFNKYAAQLSDDEDEE
jgi:hypothetical protein